MQLKLRVIKVNLQADVESQMFRQIFSSPECLMICLDHHTSGHHHMEEE